MVEFPNPFLNRAYKRRLKRDPDEDLVISYRIKSHLRETNPRTWGEFLSSCQLEERETLNEYAKAGACQFSALADQLFDYPLQDDFRPDSALRALALQVLENNEDSYRDFMLHANPRTRRQRSRGGENVGVDEYIQRMSNADCDGDHITLQAICDALKVRINVVKWVHYDNGEIADASSSDSSGRTSPTNWNIFVADTIIPRDLKNLDPRLKSVQLPERICWLSLHGEAHFKSLKCLNIVSSEVAEAKVFPHDERFEPQFPTHGSKMPSRTILSPRLKEIESVTCGICLDEVHEVPPCASLEGCSHQFHLPCITQWAAVANICPLCKHRFEVVRTKDRLISISHKDVNFDAEEGISAELEALEHVACFVCTDAGDEANLLICDGDCSRGAHTYCIGLQQIPEGNWFCQVCQPARHSASARSSRRSSATVIPVDVTSQSSATDSDDEGHTTDRSTTSEVIERRNSPDPRTASARPLGTTRPGLYESRNHRSQRVAAQRSARQRMAAVAASPWARSLSRPVPHASLPVVVEQDDLTPKRNPLDSSSDEEDQGTSDGVVKRAWADLAVAKAGVVGAKRRAAAVLARTASPTASTSSTRRPRRPRPVPIPLSNPSSAEASAGPSPIHIEPIVSKEPAPGLLPSSSQRPSVLALLNSIASGHGSVSGGVDRLSTSSRHSGSRTVVQAGDGSMASSTTRFSAREGGGGAASQAEAARALVAKLHRTLAEDAQAHERGWPMMAMQVGLRDLQARVHCAAPAQLAAYLDAGLLRALRAWLGPLPGGALPPLRLRTGVLRVLLALPVRRAHVQDSGLSLYLVRMAQNPDESRENKGLINKLLVANWSRLAVSDQPQPMWPPFYQKPAAGPPPLPPSAACARRSATADANAKATTPAVAPSPLSYSGGRVRPSAPAYGPAVPTGAVASPYLDSLQQMHRRGAATQPKLVQPSPSRQRPPSGRGR